MARPVTRNLFDSVMMDAWPRMAATVDFGLDTTEHYEALYYPIRSGELTLEKLDQILGNGPEITKVINLCESNPHKGIIFKTAYDNM